MKDMLIVATRRMSNSVYFWVVSLNDVQDTTPRMLQKGMWTEIRPIVPHEHSDTHAKNQRREIGHVVLLRRLDNNRERSNPEGLHIHVEQGILAISPMIRSSEALHILQNPEYLHQSCYCSNIITIDVDGDEVSQAIMRTVEMCLFNGIICIDNLQWYAPYITQNNNRLIKEGSRSLNEIHCKLYKVWFR